MPYSLHRNCPSPKETVPSVHKACLFFISPLWLMEQAPIEVGYMAHFPSSSTLQFHRLEKQSNTTTEKSSHNKKLPTLI